MADGASCLVYAATGATQLPPLPPLPDDYRVVLWRPSVLSPRPADDRRRVLLAWWVFHQLHVFANREYAQLLIYSGAELVHRSAIFPRWARFPFMGPSDLQIGDTWTRPDQRGRGLAVQAIRWTLEHLARPGRTIWYIVEENNPPSIRAAERGGLRRAGRCLRTARFGLRALGAFVLTAAPERAAASEFAHVSDR